MEMPQQSSLKFKFPAHIISLVVRTTGCRLGRDKLVAIGAAFVKVPNSRTLPQILEKRMFQCQVDAQEALDANCMTADELKQLQGEAKPTAQAVAQVVTFVKDCMRQDHDSFIAANNPVSSLTIFSPPAAIDHAQLLLHSGASARSCHSLVCMPPDGGTWHAGTGGGRALRGLHVLVAPCRGGRGRKSSAGTHRLGFPGVWARVDRHQAGQT